VPEIYCGRRNKSIRGGGDPAITKGVDSLMRKKIATTTKVSRSMEALLD